MFSSLGPGRELGEIWPDGLSNLELMSLFPISMRTDCLRRKRLSRRKARMKGISLRKSWMSQIEPTLQKSSRKPKSALEV